MWEGKEALLDSGASHVILPLESLNEADREEARPVHLHLARLSTQCLSSSGWQDLMTCELKRVWCKLQLPNWHGKAMV
eukprot:254441-Amphidinium_carterae.2